jgi:hypothetical protein
VMGSKDVRRCERIFSSLGFANTDGMHRAGPIYRHFGNELLIHVKETSMGGHRM